MSKIFKVIILLLFCFLCETTLIAREEDMFKRYSVETNPFLSNWFLSIQSGGQSAFYHTPDKEFADFLTPSIHLGFGKWFSPSIGIRNSAHLYRQMGYLTTYKYIGVFSDVLLNLSNIIGVYRQNRIFNFIPFAGFGWAKNLDSDRCWMYGFLPEFGIINDFRLSKAWRFNLELSCQPMFNFYGTGNTANDIDGSKKLLQVQALIGFNYELKNRGWNRTPNVEKMLAGQAARIDELNNKLSEDRYIMDQLLSHLVQCDSVSNLLYSEKTDIATAPYSLFFKLDSYTIDQTRDKVNLISIAQTAKRANLKILVRGYADKGTGREGYNKRLSKRRAESVAAELIKFGIPEENISIESMGGVDDLQPSSHNRRVVISLKK